MSYKRLDQSDFVVSADSITAPLWSTNSQTLTTLFTSSVQLAGSTGDYYLSVYQTGSTNAGAEVQFDIAYGNKTGLGSLLYNTAVAENSPTKAVYGQYRSLVLGDETAAFVFGSYQSDDFWAINIGRNRYKESIFPGSLTLKLSGSLGTISLTDDSQYTTAISFKDAGRVFNIISGSAGVKASAGGGVDANGWTTNSGSYGWLLPDIGVIMLNPTALSGSVAAGGIGLNVARNSNARDNNHVKLYTAMSGSTARTFSLNSQETITSDYIFIRPRSSEFNYSENPSYISGSTGQVIYDDFIYNPQTYITTVGLYNDTNELLAVAKLSKPIKKDFTKEALIKVRLDF